jgi:RHS repeat-associated protein
LIFSDNKPHERIRAVAGGVKVRKWVWNSDYIPVRTDYFDGFQYKNESLQYFPTAEGYVNNTVISGVNNYKYVFNYADHLGNVRVSYEKDATSGSLKILEENNYYPFGMKHSGYNSNNLQPGYKYKYNGKELQEELGLNMYDYGARNYDPALGRWMNIDPLAEQYRRWSLYTYCIDNPMRFIDPDGMGVNDVTIIGSKKDVAFQQLQSSTKMELKMDQDGRVTTTSAAQSSDDKMLLAAINNPSISVQLQAHDSNFSERSGKPMVVDAFMGNSTTDDCTTAFMEISVDAAKRWDDATGKQGNTAIHATIEGYVGALLAQERNEVFTPSASQQDARDPSSIYAIAHKSSPDQIGKLTVGKAADGKSFRAYHTDENSTKQKPTQTQIQTWPKKM